MNNSLHIKFAVFLAIALAFFVSVNLAHAAAIDNALKNMGNAAQTGYGVLPTADVPTTIGTIVGVALSFIGVLFLGLMIYGGFSWMLARGNQADVQKAKDLIEAAVIGLIIVMSAYAITAYVGDVLLRPA